MRYTPGQRIEVGYGKYQGTAGVVKQVSKGVGYWYLVQLDNYESPVWIHFLHIRGKAA